MVVDLMGSSFILWPFDRSHHRSTELEERLCYNGTKFVKDANGLVRPFLDIGRRFAQGILGRFIGKIRVHRAQLNEWPDSLSFFATRIWHKNSFSFAHARRVKNRTDRANWIRPVNQSFSTASCYCQKWRQQVMWLLRSQGKDCFTALLKFKDCQKLSTLVWNETGNILRHCLSDSVIYSVL